MEVKYKLFDRSVVREGDVFWVGVGGFTVQPMKVYDVNDSGFSYRNSSFSMRFNYNGDFLDGFLEKVTEKGIERYVSAAVLKEVRATISDAVVEE